MICAYSRAYRSQDPPEGQSLRSSSQLGSTLALRPALELCAPSISGLSVSMLVLTKADLAR